MYLGLLPLLAGVVALRFWKTDSTTRWLSWLVLIFALGSLGWYGLGWLVRETYASILHGNSSKLSVGAPVGGVYWLMVTLLPTYVYFRYPSKLMVVAVGALCAASAPAAAGGVTTTGPDASSSRRSSRAERMEKTPRGTGRSANRTDYTPSNARSQLAG